MLCPAVHGAYRHTLTCIETHSQKEGKRDSYIINNIGVAVRFGTVGVIFGFLQGCACRCGAVRCCHPPPPPPTSLPPHLPPPFTSASHLPPPPPPSHPQTFPSFYAGPGRGMGVGYKTCLEGGQRLQGRGGEGVVLALHSHQPPPHHQSHLEGGRREVGGGVGR